jgi:uncharacterized cysteine cluster protein YcgN (CxxCxxCC family)
MGELRERFWELPLAELDRAEWEALCDGCGRCCLQKIEDADTGAIAETNVACRLLDTETAQCMDYRNRKAFVPDCLRLTLKIVEEVSWLPHTCAYRLRAENRPLYSWHYLISGDRQSALHAGVGIAGRVISEAQAGPLEHHIVDWPEPASSADGSPSDD